MKNSILEIPGIYIQKEIKNMTKDVILAQKQKDLSMSEFTYYLTHEVNNKINSNGRINMGLDKNGNMINGSISVSPYSKTFESNIEPQIKNLVNILKNKRYLTYSSCEGHGYSFRRYVGIAFVNEEERDYVYNYVNNLKIFGVLLKKIETVSNLVLKSTKVKQYQLNKVQKNNNLTENEINCFNVQFHRNYEYYCFLEIIILNEIPYHFKDYIKEPIKNSILFISKLFFWNKITKILENKLSQDNFKKYKY